MSTWNYSEDQRSASPNAVSPAEEIRLVFSGSWVFGLMPDLWHVVLSSLTEPAQNQVWSPHSSVLRHIWPFQLLCQPFLSVSERDCVHVVLHTHALSGGSAGAFAYANEEQPARAAHRHWDSLLYTTGGNSSVGSFVSFSRINSGHEFTSLHNNPVYMIVDGAQTAIMTNGPVGL